MNKPGITARPRRLTVSVVVPVYRGGPAFLQCLDSIRRADPAPDEVIVVIDGPASGEDIAAEQHGFTVIQQEEQAGPAAARNLGAVHARGDLLFFVDADVTIPQTAVAVVRRTFENDPGAAALIGSYDDQPGAANFLSQYKNLCHHFVHQQARTEAFTFWGACGAIRRAVFEQHGGFDERYREPSIEDIDLGYRLRAAGHSIRMCKGLQVKHLKRWGMVSLFVTDLMRRALPWTRLILRTGRFENDLNISRTARAKVVLACGLFPALAACFAWSGAWPMLLAMAFLLLVLDFPQLRFFREKRGVLFALRTVPWQWSQYLSSGLAFAIGLLLHGLLSPTSAMSARREVKLAEQAPPLSEAA